MRFGTLVAAMAMVVSVAACGNTAEGVKQDAENASEKAADAAESTGSAVDAALETGQVKTALSADSRVDASDINVDTNNDTKTVTLKGTVPAESQIAIAADIAKSKAPSYTIVNELTVKAR